MRVLATARRYRSPVLTYFCVAETLIATALVSMMFQLDDVNQNLTISFDGRLFFVFIPGDGRRWRRVCFQEFINRCPHSGTSYHTPIFGICESLDGFQLGHILFCPDEPDSLCALLFVEAEPALLGNLNLLILRQQSRAFIGRR